MKFIASLPDGFYKTISTPIKTICLLKGQTKGTQSKQVLDVETTFLQLLLIWQKLKIELDPLFAFELCAFPPTFIVGQEYFCESHESDLVKRLSIVDISWPHDESSSDLIAPIKERLDKYPDATKNIVAPLHLCQIPCEDVAS